MLCYAGPHGLGVRPGKNCVGLTMVYWIEGHVCSPRIPSWPQ